MKRSCGLNMALVFLGVYLLLVGGGGAKAGAKSDAGSEGYQDFCAEYAKSNRSTCRGCESKIDKVNLAFCSTLSNPSCV